MSRTQGMLLSLHHDASFPLLARNLSRVIINRCNVPIINTVVKTHIRSFASTNGFQRGGSNAPLKHRADMNLSTNQAHNAKPISNPEPSASVLLISSFNEILLLHRVKTASSYASAHVFPGGHLASQDGEIPPITDVRIHDDSRPYRIAAIRECFEESGILLANQRENPNQLLILSDEDREQGRQAVHQNDVDFQAWVEQRGGIPDIENLIPFTRWLTPAIRPRRFTTQMYLYFLPLPSGNLHFSSSSLEISPYQSRSAAFQTPTSDGGLEHTAAAFSSPKEWLSLFSKGEIILFPPQCFLLTLLSPFLLPPLEKSGSDRASPGSTLQGKREALMAFIESGDPPWGEKCISPLPISRDEKRKILALDSPGPELQETNRKGDPERILVRHIEPADKNIPALEVFLRNDFFNDEGDAIEKGHL